MASDNGYEIVIGTAADIEDIVRFQVAMAMESEGTALDVERVTAGVTAVMNDSNKGFYLVAKIADETTGSLMITKEWSDWNNQWYWWVQSVYVTPKFRNKGIFKSLYAKVKELAASNSVSQIRPYVDKTNTLAQSVYSNVGMAECHYIMLEEHI